MPILKIFSIHDVKSESYGPLMTYATNGLAIREFEGLAKNKESTINRYPEDFTLIYLGTFDTDNGDLIKDQKSGHILSRASEFLNKPVELTEVKGA